MTTHRQLMSLSINPGGLISCFVCVQVGVTTFGGFEVEVVDPIADYLATLKEVFDFGMLKAFVTRADFSMVFDAARAAEFVDAGVELKHVPFGLVLV